MVEVQQTAEFTTWLDKLRDIRARARIVARIERVTFGLMGDVKSVGGSVSELRIDYGAGYRVYFTWRGDELVILLCGGDKSSQARDIAKAKEMAAELG